jgi:predicted house-cleaning noncanonical NTP pyrophosphatase (MazG superfamily)
MRKEYNKLVRDRIPEIIRQNGLKSQVATLTESAYRQALRQKLIEEAQEAAEASEQSLITELADLYEVIDTLMKAYKIDRKLVIAEQLRRRSDRGGFEKRILLLWTE